mmetsp:Transcript_93184/g.199912  ORF Transcript_93184/g.199912 Transcript_93184/m.199912 type:complete len:228 (+) Transcript_93184:2911-3594(+)
MVASNFPASVREKWRPTRSTQPTLHNRLHELHGSYCQCPEGPRALCGFTSGSRQRPRSALKATIAAFVCGLSGIRCSATMIAQPPLNGRHATGRLSFGVAATPWASTVSPPSTPAALASVFWRFLARATSALPRARLLLRFHVRARRGGGGGFRMEARCAASSGGQLRRQATSFASSRARKTPRPSKVLCTLLRRAKLRLSPAKLPLSRTAASSARTRDSTSPASLY